MPVDIVIRYDCVFWWGVVFDECMLGIDTRLLCVPLWVSKLQWPPVTTSLLVSGRPVYTTVHIVYWLVRLVHQYNSCLFGYRGFFGLSLIHTSDFNETIVTCTGRVYDKHIWLKTVLYQMFLILCVSSCWNVDTCIDCSVWFLGHLKSCRWPV